MEDNADPRERDDRNPDENYNEMMKAKDLIFDDLIKLLTGMLDISPTDVRVDMSLDVDLALDSLQLYELVIDLEEAYDIRIPDTSLDSVKTVGDVVDLVYTLTNSPT